MSRLAAFLGQAGQEYRQMRLGLHRMRSALERIGHPEIAYPSILIAGTNGKGSTARMVESVLREAGHRTGLYTSPHLLRFHERILVAGQEVSDQALEAILEDWDRRGFLDERGHWPVEGERLTWFEQATLLAFEVFRREKVEIAVLEVGLGGRMDATNVTEPLASAVVSLGRDHAEVLGETLPEIAREKAGVLRRDRPLILGQMAPEIRALFRRWAREEGAHLVEAGAAPAYPGLTLALEGRHQLANAAVAIELLQALRDSGFVWTEEALRRGLAGVQHPGRLQRLAGEPELLLDGAHNSPALACLADYLRAREASRELVFLVAMLKEKDPSALQWLEPLSRDFVFTELSNPRSRGLEAWREIAEKRNIPGYFAATPQAGLDLARELAGPKGLVVATGSLYLVAEILGIADCHSK